MSVPRKLSGYWVADWYKQYQVPLQLAHAKMLKAISNAKVKTDSIDAKTLADLLRAGLIPQVYKTDGNQRDLRELTRARLRMIDRRRRLQGSLWQLAAKNNLLVQDHYLSQAEETGLYRYVGTLSPRPPSGPK